MSLSQLAAYVRTCTMSALAVAMIVAAKGHAQSTVTNFTAEKDLILAAKTPLGDASITVPAGSAITNFEVQGEEVKVWQGPFTASVALADLRQTAAAERSPQASPDTPRSAQPAPTDATIPESAQSPEPKLTGSLAPVVAAARALRSLSVPDWFLPAAAGALVAYGFFATVALLRSGRARKPSSPSTEDKSTAAVPEGGRAIACPLCGKDIAVDKISKGRNLCPSCNWTFVGK